MVEHADGGMNQDVDTTVDDVSPEVLDKIAAGLAALTDDPKVKGDIGEKAVLNEISDGVSAISATESVISSADSVASEAVSAAGSVVSAVVSSAVVDDKNYDIEDNLYRAVIHEGWNDEQIQEFMKLDPDRARATFQKIYESTNGLSQKWADMGRAQLVKDDGQQQQDTQQKSKDDKPKVEFKEIDIDGLKKQYDNDPIVDLVAQQQVQNKVLYDMVNDLRETVSTRQEVAPQGNTGVSAEAAAVGTQVDTFFKQDDMKIFVEFYGSGDNLTPGDMANRVAVFETADAIRAGRAHQGMDTTVEEALLQAHLLVTEPVREKMVRKGIVSKMKKRSNSLSLRPASKGRDVDVAEHNKPQNDQEVVDNAAARLAKIDW